MSRVAPLIAVALVAGCSGTGNKNKQPVQTSPTLVHTTYRAISGVSMGAIGSSTLGLRHTDLFDAVAPLGGPLDVRYFAGHFLEGSIMGGFCSLSQVEAQLANDGGAGLNDPNVMTCLTQVPGTVATEHTQSFNHFQYTTSGGHFSRTSYIGLFVDLCLAYGNLTGYNPDSPFAPPGLTADQAWNPPADICTNPIRVKGLVSDPNGHPIYNKEFNPEGKYDAITFCDGTTDPVYYCQGTVAPVDFCANGGATNVIAPVDEATYAAAYCADAGGVAQATDAPGTSDPVLAIFKNSEGRFDPCRQHSVPFQVALAYDFNGNGRRDLAEPPVINSHERYSDVGTDGCADALEDGKGGCVSDPSQSPYASGTADPNGDDYDYAKNTTGTEGNWAHDPGEPFEDNGLDGVANTGDYGEGNGTYDESPNLTYFRTYDPRSNYAKLTPALQKLLDLYEDGGIRDVFNFGVEAQILGNFVANATKQASIFFGFAPIPNTDPTETELTVDGAKARWDLTERNTTEIYGTANPTQAELDANDGDHVGTNQQALDRFVFMESWIANRWVGLPLPPAPSTPGDYNLRQVQTTYFSTALNSNRDFTIYLPPGYFAPDQAMQRYPVLYLMHGYGQDEASFGATSVALFEPPMNRTAVEGYPPLNGRKYMVVFVSGRCCQTNTATGERDCTMAHDGVTGWTGGCQSGNFYANAAGQAPDAGDRYEDSFVELVHYIDENYRTLPGADVVER